MKKLLCIIIVLFFLPLIFATSVGYGGLTEGRVVWEPETIGSTTTVTGGSQWIVNESGGFLYNNTNTLFYNYSLLNDSGSIDYTNLAWVNESNLFTENLSVEGNVTIAGNMSVNNLSVLNDVEVYGNFTTNISTQGNIGAGCTADNQSQLKLYGPDDTEIMFKSGTDNAIIIGYDNSANKIEFRQWYAEPDTNYRNLGTFGRFFTIDKLGNMEINPNGFSGGGKVTAFLAGTSGSGVQTAYEAGATLGGGEGQIGDGVSYVFSLENYEGDGNGAKHNIGKWIVKWVDPTHTSEDSATIFQNMVAGSFVDALILNMTNAIFGGNVTSENVFIPQYIFSHTNKTIPVLGVGTWTNVTFSQEGADIKSGISHTYNDATNHTFTIIDSGVYEFNYDLDIEDASLGASDIEVAGRLIYTNGTEVSGSVFELSIVRQEVHTTLSHDFLAKTTAGDSFVVQFTASDSNVQISTHGLYGDHPDSSTITIKKVANL